MDSALKHILTHSYKLGMIDFMDQHPEAFKEAIQLALSNEQPYAWRSAWLLCDCIETNDKRLKPYLKKIANVIPSKEDGHQRELLKLLFKMDLSGELEGHVFDCCMNLWEDISKKPSIRYYAFHMLVKISDKHPELKNELKFMFQEHYTETLTPGVKKGILKIIKQMH